MEHSNTYYIVRGIVRGIVKLGIAALIALGFYAFILMAWAIQWRGQALPLGYYAQ